MRIALIIAAGFILDALFGDPRFIPHPVVFIGKLISAAERWIRSACPKTPKGEFWGGALTAFIVITLSFFLPLGLLILLYTFNFWAGVALEIWFCFQIFAACSLKRESMKVYSALEQGDTEKARLFVSYIVGRDTEALDERGIVKATVETVAENTTDGVIAPLFYMLLGGAPLAFLYKAVNTLDSMVGYKNEKYLYFGRFSARLDDVMNFIPARIGGFLMVLSAFLTGLDGRNAFRIFRRDRRRHSSPNSAQTESACAGALNIRLAGDAFYFGKLYKKPTIGDPDREPEKEDIRRANRLMYVTSVLAVTASVLIAVAVWIAVKAVTS